MATEKVQRKLTAILSADVRGYSRLMGQDEVATVQTLKTYREVMRSLFEQHRGRVVDSPGDNVLAEFVSVVDAVECAVEIQRELKRRNSDLAKDRKMEFRIGVNLGDVIEDEDRIYGDGVNIAARVESLAEGGGICISGTAYDHVENKLRLEYEFLGEQEVKNIVKPVRVYRVRMESAVTETSREPKLPQKPSIAVLPFVNMSGDPEQEYFSDGITEDLITDLSKISGLFVIARNSVFIYKGKAVKVADVGRELGVRNVLEGSVRKVGDRVRITAQLVDTTTEGHLWAERYDRDLEDIFALQDEVTQKIVKALAVALTEEEEDRLARKYTENVEAYDCYLRGLEYHFHITKEANIQARQMFEKAIDLDSEFAAAYSLLAWTHLREWTMWSQDPQCLDRAFELAQRARDLDDTLSEAHFVLGEVYLWKKQHERAIAEIEKSIAISPNYADAIAELGDVLNFAGRPEEAIELVRKAMRLNPTPPSWYSDNLGRAYLLSGEYEEAIAAFKRLLNRNPNYWIGHAYLAASYIELGRDEDGRAEVAEVLRINPMLSLETWRQIEPFRHQAVSDRVFGALRKAGLK